MQQLPANFEANVLILKVPYPIDFLQLKPWALGFFKVSKP